MMPTVLVNADSCFLALPLLGLFAEQLMAIHQSHPISHGIQVPAHHSNYHFRCLSFLFLHLPIKFQPFVANLEGPIFAQLLPIILQLVIFDVFHALQAKVSHARDQHLAEVNQFTFRARSLPINFEDHVSQSQRRLQYKFQFYIFIDAKQRHIVSNFSKLITIITKFMDTSFTSSKRSSSSSQIRSSFQASQSAKQLILGTLLAQEKESKQSQQIVIQQVAETQISGENNQNLNKSLGIKVKSRKTDCSISKAKKDQKHDMISLTMYQECIRKLIDSYFDGQEKPKLQDFEDETLLRSWKAFYESLIEKISFSKENKSCQFEEQESSLNQAIMYETEEDIEDKSNRAEEEDESILIKKSTSENDSSSESRILKTPIIDLINNAYPEKNNKKTSSFQFSYLEDSSFDFSKTFTAHDHDFPMLDSLMKLSYAQTELTYLCQYKGWRVLFIEGICKEQSYVVKPAAKFIDRKAISTRSTSKVPKFNCVTEVNAEIKGVYKKIFGQCQIANSKKEAKHISSLLCLYQLYQTIDGLWHEYEATKMDKPSLVQDLSADNMSIFTNAGIDTSAYSLMRKYLNNSSMHEKFENKGKLQDELTNKENERFQENRQTNLFLLREEKPEQKYEKSPNRVEISEYVNNLEAPKKQLYYFIAQNKTVFLTPQWHFGKKGSYFWQVQGCVKYEKKNEFFSILYKSTDKSKKFAEKKIAIKILIELYTLFPVLYQKYKEVKNAKNLC